MTYTSYGTLNKAGTNGCLVGHSLTSNTNVHEWWSELIGEGPSFALDTTKYFVVCINYLGSPYGSASPITPFPGGKDGEVYGPRFPRVSIRDNVVAQKMLLDVLGVKKLALCTGGSMGAMLALEMAATYPDFVDELVLIAGCAAHTDWAIGIGDVQRHTIRADPAFNGGNFEPGQGPTKGLYAARMGAMLTYRTPQSITARFRRSVQMGNSGLAAVAKDDGLPFFSVESYLRYQGEKFVKRFDANCYLALTYTLDSHDVGRGRAEGDSNVDASTLTSAAVVSVLRNLKHRTLLVGIDSDALYPIELQRDIAARMPNSLLHTIQSPHGHDSFLIEIVSLNRVVCEWRLGKYYGEMVKDTCCSSTRDWTRCVEEAASPRGGLANYPSGIYL